MNIGKAKQFTAREFAKILAENGFEYVSTKGDHKKYRKGRETVVINLDLNKMVTRRLIKEHNLKF